MSRQAGPWEFNQNFLFILVEAKKRFILCFATRVRWWPAQGGEMNSHRQHLPYSFPSPTCKDAICLFKDRSLGRPWWWKCSPPVKKFHDKPILNGYLPQTALFIKTAPASVPFYHMETHENTQAAAFKGSRFIYHLIPADLGFSNRAAEDIYVNVSFKGISSHFGKNWIIGANTTHMQHWRWCEQTAHTWTWTRSRDRG